jgi:hypothetical protein
MRLHRASRRHLFPLAALALSFAAVAAVAGCEEDAPLREPTEAGARSPHDDDGEDDEEETEEPEPDDAGTDAPSCDLDADFTTKIADASIADGQSTTAHCVRCAKTSCRATVEACNGSCACKGVAAEGLECFAKKSGDRSCAEPFRASAEAEPLGRDLLSCSRTKCPEECQVDPFADAGP